MSIMQMITACTTVAVRVIENVILFIKIYVLIRISQMTDDGWIKLKALLVLHEGKKNFPYYDTATPPRITIGIGYDLTDRGLPDTWVNQQYDDDVACFYHRLSTDFPWFKSLNDARQAVLINMCFMGYKHFQEFVHLFAALAVLDFDKAAQEIVNSQWAVQTKGRAIQLANMMRSGEF